MGLFSNKTKVYVDVAVSPLVSEEQDFIKNAILRGTIGQSTITEALQKENLGGFFSKVNTFYRRARDSNYVGLPTGALTSSNIKQQNIESVLFSIHGQTPELWDYSWGPPNPIVEAQIFLKDVVSLDIQTHYMNNPAALGLPTGTKFIEANWNIDTGGLDITFETSTDVFETHNYNITNDTSQTYLYVIYAIGTTQHIFKYDVGDQYTYPELSINIVEMQSEYMPIVPLRTNKENLQEGTPRYDEIKKILKTFKIDLDELYDTLMEENPDNDPELMDDVFFMFGINIKTETKAGLEYLYRYFKKQGLEAEYKKTNWDSYVEADGQPPINLVEIISGEFKCYISFNYIESEIDEGVIGPKNTIVKSYDLTPPKIVNIGSGIWAFSDTNVFPTSSLIIKKQISDTHYETITVAGLSHTHLVYGKNNVVTRTLEDLVNVGDNTSEEEDEGFYLPVSKLVVDSMPGFRKSFLYQEALNITIYTVQLVKVKWYQRGAFKYLMYIVAIVVTFWDWSGSIGQFIISLVSSVVASIVLGSLISFGVDLLANVFGLENVAIFAAIVFVVSVYYGVGDNALPLATDMIEITTMSLDSVTTLVQEELVGIMNEMQDFALSYKEKMEKLEEEWDMLRGTQIDYLSITRGNPVVISWETPQMMFSRMLDQNPGIKSIDVINYWHKFKLELPKFDAFSANNIYSVDNEQLYVED